MSSGKLNEILKELRSHSNPENVTGMARFGINPKNTYGVSIPVLRGLAKRLGKNHFLAGELWLSGVHEARILAALIDDPKLVTEAQMECWVKDFDSWDVCDSCCMNLFDKSEFAYSKALEWSERQEEFVKRAGFALMASLAFHDKNPGKDAALARFLPVIKRESIDERNYVRKAVNWALRQIGKRSKGLNEKAVRTAREIRKLDSKAAKWIASDALRELESAAVQNRLHQKG